MISYQDFLNWKQDPVTKKFFEDVEDKIEQCKQLLDEDAGKDPESDRYMCGMARAYYNILATEFDGEEE